MATEHRDRILDWQEELRRLEPDLPSLPLAARRAVRLVLESFAREDEERGSRATQALDDAA